MQLALYENNALVLDLTSYVVDNQIEFTTGDHGFGYLKVNTRLLLPQILQLYTQKKVYHVRLGYGSKVIWEGRLEDVEIKNNPTLVAYGYWRSFSDLQVTDLWSTTKLDLFNPSQRETSFPNAYDDKAYNFSKDRSIYIGVKNNVSYGNSPLNAGGYDFYLTSGYSRAFQCVSYLSSGIVANSFVFGFLSRDSPGIGAYSTIAESSSSAARNTTIFIPDKPYIQFYYYRNAANALFVGEDNSQYAKFSSIRIGTTPSISGNRLYADEIVRFYTSGVYTLNPNQINPTTKYIQSPQYDITDLQFNDVTGIDAIEEVLRYPSSNGVSYRFQVWEDKIVYFEPKTARNTYYARFSDLKITRTFDTTYTQDRIVYQDANDITQRTSFYTLQTWDTQRQSNTKIDNVSVTAVQTAKIADAAEKERIEIITDWLQTTQGNFIRAYECRSGDRIVFIDLPGYLTDVVDNSFMVAETITNLQTGYTRIIPEQQIAQLDSLIARSKI